MIRRISRAAGAGTAFLLLAASALAADLTEWSQQKEAGRKAYESGSYSEAERLGREALGLAQRAYAVGSSEVAGCLNDLAVAETAIGKFADAEGHYRQALEIWEKTPGHEGAEARILSNLSILLTSQAQYGEAEALALRSLEIQGHRSRNFSSPRCSDTGKVIGGG